MNSLNAELDRRLVGLRERDLLRELRRMDSAQGPRIEISGRTLLNFSSNDYLGLANHPALKEASVRAIEKFGAGAGASRLICGSLAPFHELEEALAAFKKTEAALTFSTGYAAAVGTVTALVGKADVIIVDKLVHASIVDAARLAGSKLRVFAHNDLNDLEDKLKWANQEFRTKNPTGNVLIITESVFSMDGDVAPLREIVALKEKYGAWLMVDEAHATGILGRQGRGLADELGVSQQIEVQMGTLGKAFGAAGGYICGSRTLVDFLINSARSFIFSTAPVPATAAAATAGLQLATSAEGDARRKTLRQLVEQLNSKLQPDISKPGAIIPLILGEESKAIKAASHLRAQNIHVPAIRFPTVARGAARLRITLTATHSAEDVSLLVQALKPFMDHK